MGAWNVFALSMITMIPIAVTSMVVLTTPSLAGGHHEEVDRSDDVVAGITREPPLVILGENGRRFVLDEVVWRSNGFVISYKLTRQSTPKRAIGV